LLKNSQKHKYLIAMQVVDLWRKSAVYCDRPRTLNELKTAITVFIRNISQADLQKVFANKIKRVQACIDALDITSHTFY
jgi:hypothetical protein